MSRYTYCTMPTEPNRKIPDFPIPEYIERPYKFGDYLTSNLTGKTYDVKTYKDVSISTRCFQTEPCFHEVRLPSGEEKRMGGREIYKIIPKKHPMYKHFKRYDDNWEKNWNKMRQLSDERSEQYEKEYSAKVQLEEQLSNYNKLELIASQPGFKLH